MIEISNTFILVWLVVLALICIYLLYMSLTRNNETDSLKSSISNLVRQNKKRDELINFLMERVETLTNAVNNLALPSPQETNSNTTNIAENPGNAEPQVDNPEPQQKTTELSLDDVLNSISLPIQPSLDTNQEHHQLTQNITDDADIPFASSEFPEEISNSEFGENAAMADTLIDNTGNTEFILKHEAIAHNIIPSPQTQQINLDDVLQSIPTTFKDDDLISTILGADDSASQQGEEYHSNEPPGKIRLLGMNVKQLKQIAKDMNIKSRGNKTDLVESIWSKMNKYADNTGYEYISQAQQHQQPELSNATQHEPLQELMAEHTTEKTIGSSNQEINNIPQLVVEEFPDDI